MGTRPSNGRFSHKAPVGSSMEVSNRRSTGTPKGRAHAYSHAQKNWCAAAAHCFGKACRGCTLHAFNRRACGVQACDPARQACRACTPVWRGVQSLHALQTGVQALHACRLM
ncbi:hypothetical protein PCANC_19525 [Puccinia coronata f. sp. avenae]|uniref:Uncharacterized protein n=1 Tax=Puccinia coronata f. sp. avenae TaxID=200324 RepID=A0A2N5SKM4_9BASI|nr:hypothetical protein PCANC_19525 [Puccinia coronata f. sp. avenae]